jgi:hypothetical protein
MEGSDRGPLFRCTAVLTLDRSNDKSRQFDVASVLVCNRLGSGLKYLSVLTADLLGFLRSVEKEL